MQSAGSERAGADTVSASPAYGKQLFWPAPILLIAGLMMLEDQGPITEFLDGIIPLAGKVRSLGFSFPTYYEAFPHTVRILGGGMAVAGLAWFFLALRPSLTRFRWPSMRLATSIALANLLLVSFAVYMFLADPFNAYPSDARIHWVDIYYPRGLNAYFYVLVKPVHMLFYDSPHISQGLLGMANVFLAYAIGRRMLESRWLALGMSASLLFSGQMLLSADGASDVTLATWSLLVAMFFYVRRGRGAAFGASLFLVTLARPPFGLLAVAFVMIEFFLPRQDDADAGRSWLRSLRGNRFLWLNLAAFVILFVSWHLALTALDEGWILTDGKLFGTRLFDIEARDAGGFVAQPFDGAFLWHALWIYPLPVLVGSCYSAIRARSLPYSIRKVFLVIWAFVSMSFVMHEALVIKGFTVKYVSYYVPLLIIAGWTVLRIPRKPRRQAMVAAVVVMLMVGPAATYQNAIKDREARIERPLTQLLPHKHELRALTAGRAVASGLRGQAYRNFLAYVLKRDFAEIRLVNRRRDLLAGEVIFLSALGRYEGEPILWQGNGLYLVEPAQPWP